MSKAVEQYTIVFLGVPFGVVALFLGFAFGMTENTGWLDVVVYVGLALVYGSILGAFSWRLVAGAVLPVLALAMGTTPGAWGELVVLLGLGGALGAMARWKIGAILRLRSSPGAGSIPGPRAE